jgi:hypothetical protein
MEKSENIFFIIAFTILLIGITYTLFKLFKQIGRGNKYLKRPKDITDLLSEVEVDEKINITYWQQNVNVRCLNNNPIDKEIYLELTFDGKDGQPDYTKEIVFPYTDNIFKHYRTLNILNEEKGDIVFKFEKELNFLVKEQEFEEAAVIHEAIQKIKSLKIKKQYEKNYKKTN